MKDFMKSWKHGVVFWKRRVIKINYYFDDFETTNDPKDCRVWLWASVGALFGEVETGTDLDSYFDYLLNHPGTHFFHNLKFDGHFIVWQLLHDDFQWVKWEPSQAKALSKTQFSTIINSENMWYAIILKNYFGKLIQIFDSSKIIPAPISKDHLIDYNLPRPINYKPTEQEIAYCINDCMWVRNKMQPIVESNSVKITAGSIALNTFKTVFLGADNFRYFFPPQPKEWDADMRRAYTGGWNWLNPTYANKLLDDGLILDVNSIYNYCLTNYPMPFGNAKRFDGQYVQNDKYPLYLQDITFDAELKEGHLPSLMLPDKLSANYNGRHLESTFLVDDDGLGSYHPLNLLLSNIDLDNLTEDYEIFNISYNGGWMFHAKQGLFDDYVNCWFQRKQSSPKGSPERAMAKLMLVSLIGKFGTKPQTHIRQPYLSHDILRTKILADPDERKTVYLPLAIFVNAYARHYILQFARLVQDRLIYCDVDSLHLLSSYVPHNLPLHETDLGKFKLETNFFQAKYLKTKYYAYNTIQVPKSNIFLRNYSDPFRSYTHTNVVCAGIPQTLHRQISLDNFREGTKLYGKLEPVSVPGGLILKPKAQVI